MISVSLEDNSKEVLEALDRQILVALKSCGQTAEGYAKKNCPVDTGRLRNSITFAIAGYHSPANMNKHPKGKEDARPEDSAVGGDVEDGYMYLGTNVEYAPRIEYGDMEHKVGRKHFLRDAIATHETHYKKIIEAALKA